MATITLKVEAGDAKRESDALKEKISKVGAAGVEANKNLAASFESLGKAIRDQAAAFERLEAIQDKNARANQPLVQNFKALTEELKRQDEILRRIRGPQEDFMRTQKSLNSLLAQGKISAADYNAQMSDSRKRSGMGNPVDAVSLPGAQESEGGGMDLKSKLTSALAPAAIAAVGIGAINKLREAWKALGEEYTKLSNEAQKIVRTNESVTEVLYKQYAASRQLHASLHDMLGLMDAVRDGTDEMNLTGAEQQNLAMGIGAAIRLENKELSEASGLMNTLSYAFANGTINGRELKGIMKQYPDLAAQFSESTGKNRGDMVKMANQGKFTADMLIDNFNKAGTAMQEKLTDRVETADQKMQHFKDRMATMFGSMAQSKGKMLDVLGDLLDPYEDLRNEMLQSAQAARFEDEINAKMIKNLDKLIERKETLAAMEKVGLDTGNVKSKDYDVENVTAYERLRSVMAGVTINGVNIGSQMKNAFGEANSKVALMTDKMQDLVDQHAQAKIAEEVKSTAIQLDKVNTAIDAANTKWRTQSDRVLELKKAIDIAQKAQLDLIKNNPKMDAKNLADPQLVRDRRALVDAERDLSVTNGVLSQTSADVLKKETDLKNNLKDLNRDRERGEVNAKQYWEALKALGIEESRVGKLLREIREPVIHYTQDTKQLAELFKKGAINANTYDEALRRLTATYGMTDFENLLKVAGALPKNQEDIRKEGLRKEPANQNVSDEFKEAFGDAIEGGAGLEKQLRSQIDAQDKYRESVHSSMYEVEKFSESTVDLSSDLSQATARWETAGRKWNAVLNEAYRKPIGKEMSEGFDMVAQKIAASANAANVMVRVFDDLSNAITDFVVKGEFDVQKMVQSMLRELTKLLMMKLLVASIGGGGTGAGAATASALSRFASGGMILPGSGGTDSQVVAFRKSPNETVRVHTPEQERAFANGAGPGQSGDRGVVVQNYISEQTMRAAMSSASGKQIILNVIKSEMPAMRRMFGG